MAIIKGYLVDGTSTPITDCTIVLKAKKNSSSVLIKTEGYEVSQDGYYEMSVLPCNYDVVLQLNGHPPKNVGTIQVFSDSEDGSLNDFLLNPMESELTPEVVGQIIGERQKAQNAAITAQSAAECAESAKLLSENFAEIAQTSAETSQHLASDIETVSELVQQSTATAEKSASDAKASADYIQQSIDVAEIAAVTAQQSSVIAEAAATSASKSEQEVTTKAIAVQQFAEDGELSATVAQQSAEQAEVFAKQAQDAAKIAVAPVDSKADKTLKINGHTLDKDFIITADEVQAVPAQKLDLNDLEDYLVDTKIKFDQLPTYDGYEFTTEKVITELKTLIAETASNSETVTAEKVAEIDDTVQALIVENGLGSNNPPILESFFSDDTKTGFYIATGAFFGDPNLIATPGCPDDSYADLSVIVTRSSNGMHYLVTSSTPDLPITWTGFKFYGNDEQVVWKQTHQYPILGGSEPNQKESGCKYIPELNLFMQSDGFVIMLGEIENYSGGEMEIMLPFEIDYYVPSLIAVTNFASSELWSFRVSDIGPNSFNVNTVGALLDVTDIRYTLTGFSKQLAEQFYD